MTVTSTLKKKENIKVIYPPQRAGGFNPQYFEIFFEYTITQLLGNLNYNRRYSVNKFNLKTRNLFVVRSSLQERLLIRGVICRQDLDSTRGFRGIYMPKIPVNYESIFIWNRCFNNYSYMGFNRSLTVLLTSRKNLRIHTFTNLKRFNVLSATLRLTKRVRPYAAALIWNYVVTEISMIKNLGVCNLFIFFASWFNTGWVNSFLTSEKVTNTTKIAGLYYPFFAVRHQWSLSLDNLFSTGDVSNVRAWCFKHYRRRRNERSRTLRPNYHYKPTRLWWEVWHELPDSKLDVLDLRLYKHWFAAITPLFSTKKVSRLRRGKVRGDIFLLSDKVLPDKWDNFIESVDITRFGHNLVKELPATVFYDAAPRHKWYGAFEFLCSISYFKHKFFWFFEWGRGYFGSFYDLKIRADVIFEYLFFMKSWNYLIKDRTKLHLCNTEFFFFLYNNKTRPFFLTYWLLKIFRKIFGIAELRVWYFGAWFFNWVLCVIKGFYIFFIKNQVVFFTKFFVKGKNIVVLNYYNTLLNWRFSFNTFFFFLSLTFSKWGWVTIKNYLILVLLCLIALPVLLLSVKSLTTIFTWVGIVSSLIFLWFCVICLGFIRTLFQYIPALVRGAKSVPSYTISSLLPKLPLPELFFKLNLISFSKIYCKTLYLFFGGLFTTGCTYWFTQLFTKVVVNLRYYFNRNFLILLFFREIAATVTVFFFGTALGKHESKLLRIKFNESRLLNFVTLRLQQTWLYFTKFRYSWYLPSNRALVSELSTYFRVINRPLLLAKWNVYWLVYVLGGEFGWWVTSNNKTFKLSAFFRNRLSLFWVFGWRECRVVRYISKYVVFNKIYYEFLGFRSFTQILLFLLLVELPISGGYIVSSITRFISGLPLNLQFAVVHQKIENLLREHEFFRYLNTGLLLIRPTLLNFTRFQPADHLSVTYLLFLRWLLVALLIVACFILCVMLWIVSLLFFFYKSVFMGFGVVKKKLIRLFFYYN